MDSVKTLDKSVSGCLKDSTCNTVVCGLLVLYMVMLGSIKRSVLELFENVLFQVAYLALTAYVALIRPATAILMASAYLFTIQELNHGKPMKAVVVKTTPNGTVVVPTASLTDAGNMVNHNNVAEGFNAPEDDPAYKTMTENLDQGVFTTDKQFHDAQSNKLPGVNQMEGVKSWNTQFTAQGTDLPHGYNPEEYTGFEM